MRIRDRDDRGIACSETAAERIIGVHLALCWCSNARFLACLFAGFRLVLFASRTSHWCRHHGFPPQFLDPSHIRNDGNDINQLGSSVALGFASTLLDPSCTSFSLGQRYGFSSPAASLLLSSAKIQQHRSFFRSSVLSHGAPPFVGYFSRTLSFVGTIGYRFDTFAC